MTKTRLEAFSDGVFAIILTILVLELAVPEIEGTDLAAFLKALAPLAPKFLAFAFSFFLIAIFWVNHHHYVQAINTVDTKLMWLNMLFLFFTTLFPFIAAFIGDYPDNCFVVALYPANMLAAGLSLRAFWRYSFVHAKLNIDPIPDVALRLEARTHSVSALINLALIGLAFVHPTATLVVLLTMPFFFIIPSLRQPPSVKP